jgi:Ni,Fe-hydrogenase III component G
MDLDAIGRLLEREIPRDRFRCSADGERRVSVEIGAGDSKGAVRALRRGGKARFVTLAAVDKGEDVELLYTLAVGGTVVIVRTPIPKETSRTESITDVVPAAELIEKEVSELFGIVFAGHPRQKNLILPDDWSAGKAPLRKPLAGNVLPQARLTVENLLRDAASVRVSPSSMARREQAGLPKRPPLASGSEESMREFIEMVMRTGFDKRAGYDWGKKRLRYR